MLGSLARIQRAITRGREQSAHHTCQSIPHTMRSRRSCSFIQVILLLQISPNGAFSLPTAHKADEHSPSRQKHSSKNHANIVGSRVTSTCRRGWCIWNVSRIVIQIRPLNVVLEIGLLLEQTQVFGSKAK